MKPTFIAVVLGAPSGKGGVPISYYLPAKDGNYVHTSEEDVMAATQKYCGSTKATVTIYKAVKKVAPKEVPIVVENILDV